MTNKTTLKVRAFSTVTFKNMYFSRDSHLMFKARKSVMQNLNRHGKSSHEIN